MQSQITGLIVPAMALLFAGVFAVLWWFDRERRYILTLGASFAFMAGGFLIFHLTPDPNGALSVLLMHAVYSAAVYCMASGVCERAGVAMRLNVVIVIAAVSGAMLYFTTFSDDQGPRLYVANSAYGLVLALAAQKLMDSGRMQAIDRLLVAVFAFTAAQFFVRPYVTIVAQGAITSESYRESPYYSIVILTMAFVSLALAMSLLAACIIDRMQAMKSDSERDMLTGVLARRAFESQAIAMLERGNASGHPVSAIIADIDHFKRVNDIWGHQVGDSAIAGFGQLLERMVRGGDIVGRIGGEEFCIMVWNCDETSARGLADRIRKSFTECRFDGMDEGFHLTASFGVAEQGDTEGYGRLFRRADSALYSAKDQGRNRVVVASEDMGPSFDTPQLPEPANRDAA